MTKNLKWAEFYMEFADKLLKYKNNRTELIQKLKNIYQKVDFSWSIFERNSNDIDPFTVFALFNRQLTNENRTIITRELKEEFSLESDVPLNFNEIPIVNNHLSTFYNLHGSGKEIDALWDLFDIALKFSSHNESRNNLIFSYDEIIKMERIKWNITSALFWIRPYVFVSLGNENRKSLLQESSLDNEIKIKLKQNRLLDGEEYFNLCAIVHPDFYEKNDLDAFEELTQDQDAEDEISTLYENTENEEEFTISEKNVDYWVFAPGENARKWDEFYENGIMAIGWNIGNLKNFKSKMEIENKIKEVYNEPFDHPNDRACLWDFANRIKPGDIVYAKRGTNEIIGRGIVQSDYIYDRKRSEYKHVRKVKWIDRGSWFYKDGNRRLPLKTLTNITYIGWDPHKYDMIRDFFDWTFEPPENPKKYDKGDFLKEVYIDEKDYDILERLLNNKKNLILQGAPGVGKTFISKRLAYSLIGSKREDQVLIVQFHQSYSYEDFVMGYRPTDDGFELKNGSFYNFCKKAIDDSENKYYFIIDEINRGNLSKIFGELFMLIENDKRGEKVQLLYSNEEFYIPDNLYIIGLMNTADRSIAMIDYALRRRFAFFDLKPGFSSKGFEDYQSSISNAKFDRVIESMKELNATIKDDETLGEGFRIGHSFFCNLSSDDVEEKLNYIIEYEIIPLLKEYWFDEPDKVEEWSEKLRNSLKE